MVRGRPGGCGQVRAEEVVPEEAPQRVRNTQDVVMMEDQNSQPAFEINYYGNFGGGYERYGGASMKSGALDHSGMFKIVHIYGDAIFYERIRNSSVCVVDWTKPPIYDEYEEEEEVLIIEDGKHDSDIQFHCKLPSCYCDPFLVEPFIQVLNLNSRTSSFEEGVTDAGQIWWKYVSVSEILLLRSKRRIRGRIEGLGISAKLYHILIRNGILKITRINTSTALIWSKSDV